jgi:4-diphosphocytidyl-2-C-methyl-D-erythritol kinase
MKIHLHKLIPTGAGLGGGSADGAFTLKLINDLIGNPLSNAELIEMALKLGSDCPFFIINSPCIGSGRGEILQPSKIDLSGYSILLVNPGIHVNTGKAYSLSNPKPWESNLDQLLTNDPQDWRNNVINDFEKVVFVQHPQIEKIKIELYNLGAEYAAMSGSGSTVFGIFKSEPTYSNLFKDYFTKLILLK